MYILKKIEQYINTTYESGIKGSVKSIVKRCGLNHDILEQVVFGKTFVG